MGSHNQLCTYHALINLLVSIHFTFTHDIKWSKQLGAIKMVCCKTCHGELVACSVMWHEHRTEVQTSQSDTTRSIEECSWRFPHRRKTERLQTVDEVYLKCSVNLLEASWTVGAVVLRTGFRVSVRPTDTGIILGATLRECLGGGGGQSVFELFPAFRCKFELNWNFCLSICVCLCLSVCLCPHLPLCLLLFLSLLLTLCVCLCLSLCFICRSTSLCSLLCLSLTHSLCLSLSLFLSVSPSVCYVCVCVCLSLSLPACVYLSLFFCLVLVLILPHNVSQCLRRWPTEDQATCPGPHSSLSGRLKRAARVLMESSFFT